MREKTLSVAILSMCVACIILLKIPPNRFSVLIAVLNFILIFGIFTLMLLVVLGYLKRLAKLVIRFLNPPAKDGSFSPPSVSESGKD